MCTDFTNLNKCCPKDDFPLARIDQIVDSVASSDITALLDCFLGYHQICLCKEGEEKTSFITPFGTYCNMRMPEGLHNAGPTFCRMTKETALKDQVGRNVFSYIDDIVVASKKKASYIADLIETFANMHEAKLKFNLEKCVFGVTRGKVLGFWHPLRAWRPALKNNSNSSNTTTVDNQGGVKIGRSYSSTEFVYSKAGREKFALFQRVMGLHKS
jgi:hypothetical protein